VASSTLAVHYGFSYVVVSLVSSGTPINARDPNGKTALHVAIRVREEQIAQSPLQNGIDVNAQDTGIGTALHFAIHNEDAAAGCLLLQAGVDPNARTGLKSMTFYPATERNNQEIVKLLFEHGADPNNPTRKTIENIGWPYSAVIKGRSVTGGPIRMAAWRGFVDLVAILLDAGAVIEGEELLMLARGRVQEALQAVGKTGAFPYHFHNQLPDYTEVVEVLRKHLDEDEGKSCGKLPD